MEFTNRPEKIESVFQECVTHLYRIISKQSVFGIMVVGRKSVPGGPSHSAGPTSATLTRLAFAGIRRLPLLLLPGWRTGQERTRDLTKADPVDGRKCPISQYTT